MYSTTKISIFACKLVLICPHSFWGLNLPILAVSAFNSNVINVLLGLQEFEGDYLDDLCATLKQLATDSKKYRAKKDRRQQRSSFRDVLRAVQVGFFFKFRIYNRFTLYTQMNNFPQ